MDGKERAEMFLGCNSGGSRNQEGGIQDEARGVLFHSETPGVDVRLGGVKNLLLYIFFLNKRADLISLKSIARKICNTDQLVSWTFRNIRRDSEWMKINVVR